MVRKKFSFPALLILAAWILSGAPLRMAEGVPARPGVRTHTQSDGTVVSYRVVGDEFLHYMTDTGGNLLTLEDDGDLYYAEWISESDFQASKAQASSAQESKAQKSSAQESQAPGAAVSAKKFRGFVISRGIKVRGGPSASSMKDLSMRDMQPLKTPVPRFILEHAGKRMEKRDAAWRRRRGSMPKMSAGSRTPDAPDKAQDNSGIQRNLLVVYVRFKDESDMPELADKEISSEAISGLIFNDARRGSVAHYYREVTGGGIKFIPAKEIDGTEDDGIIRVTVPGQHLNWGITDDDEGFIKSVIIPALEAADEQIDVSFYDINKDAVLTSDELSMIFVIHGYEASYNSVADNTVWGHARYSLYFPDYDIYPPVLDGIEVVSYCVVGAFNSKGNQSEGINPKPFTIGLTAHELGHHSFGFLDFYNLWDDTTGGMAGYWSLMGFGNWGFVDGEDAGSTPTGLDALHLSWYSPPAAVIRAEDLAGGQRFSLTNSSQYAVLKTPGDEYYLLQPRGKVGYDRGHVIVSDWASWNAPYGGLMIYHIDEAKSPVALYSLTGSDINPDWRTHPFLDVEEAHGGTQHMQTDEYYGYVDGDGTAEDLFFGDKNKFSASTDPSSILYSGDPSNVSITEITPVVTGENTPEGSVTVSFTVSQVTEVTPDEDAKIELKGGGCNAAGFGAVVLAAAALLRKKKQRGKKQFKKTPPL